MGVYPSTIPASTATGPVEPHQAIKSPVRAKIDKMQPFRFGAYVSGEGIQAFRYAHHFYLDADKKCLTVAPSDQQTALMLAIAEQFPQPPVDPDDPFEAHR